MSRVMIEEKAFVNAKRLASLVGINHFEMLGRLACLWRESQAAEVHTTIERDIIVWLGFDVDTAPSNLIEALLIFGFIHRNEHAQTAQNSAHLCIKGNKKHIDAIAQKRESAALGGAARQAQVRKNLENSTQIKHPAEHPAELVAQLSTVQYSAVQEELPKVEESDSRSIREHIAQQVERVYQIYPRKEGKLRGMKILKSLTMGQLEKFEMAVKNYANSVRGRDVQYIKQWDTFCRNWEDYVDFKPTNHEPKKAVL